MKNNMKRVLGVSVLMLIVFVTSSKAQNTKVDEQRMTRDIEVAENILNTLIRQQFDKRVYFPMNVNGDYLSGYGVTFRLPPDYFGPMVISMEGAKMWMDAAPQIYSYSFEMNGNEETRTINKDTRDANRENLKVATKKRISNASDSAKTAYNDRVVEASKNFMADYGDLIGQLGSEERILITNQGGEGQRSMFGGNPSKRTYISVEATKGDINQFRQNKMTREQLMTKIKVVNSESSAEVDPDLELLSSILGRLYEPDLSKTFFTQQNIYYERLKDFGVIYYMQVYSSNEGGNKTWNMPTVGMNDIDKEKRDAKVKELYPQFEKEIKENILDYGRTLKSLKDEEAVVVSVKMTKCVDCGIPSSLELSVKESVLKDYSSGKLTKEAALAKISTKKGANQ
jgi:hypothetical protein